MVKRVLQGGAPSGIYKITRLKTGEVYIGKSTNVKDRWIQHCKTVYGAGTIAHSILHTTMAKDGLEQFTFELVEAIEPMTVTHDMHFIGTLNEWGTTYEDGELALTESTDKATWTGILVVTEEMYADWTATDPANPFGEKCAAVKLYNTINGGYFSPDGNNIFLKAGTYAFKYTVEGDVVEYAECNYYLVGTFVDGEGAPVNFAVKAGVTPQLTVEGTTATCTLVATDVTSLGDFSWIADQGKPGVFAFKVVYGSELGVAEWYGDDANGGDNYYVAAGSWTVTFDTETHAVSIVAA